MTEPTEEDILAGIMGLADVDVSEDDVKTWTPEQRKAAEEWAGAVHFQASDNDVEVPPKPEFLSKYSNVKIDWPFNKGENK